MQEAADRPLLRRLAKPPAPLTPGRALRLAAVRAAERSIGLPLAVLGIRVEEGPLDDLLGQLEEGLLLLALRDDSGPVGLAALDAEARAAAVEVQALGRVSDQPADPRPPTAADAALTRPLVAAVLRDAEEAIADTPLAGWIDSPRLGERLPGAREAALLLPDGTYRVVRLTLDLGPGGRQGLLLLLLQLPRAASSEDDARAAPRLSDAVLRAEAAVQAVLHRLRLSLGEAEALVPGHVLRLPGVTVASVRLTARGLDLGPARLGQVAGMRAVRVEQPLAPALDPLPGGGAPPQTALALPESTPSPLAESWSLQSEGAPEWEPPATD